MHLPAQSTVSRGSSSKAPALPLAWSDEVAQPPSPPFRPVARTTFQSVYRLQHTGACW
jgi:hypothetical protein